jgi:VWFA-related protein
MRQLSRTRSGGLWWLALVLGAPLPWHLAAQQNDARPGVIRSDSTEVLVDVVVRDKQGRLIRGLKANELALTEDGKPQEITFFREVRLSGGTRLAPEQAPASSVKPNAAHRELVQISKQIRLVSLVFDRLGPEGRRLGRQAALDFLKNDNGPNVYYAVFTIDRGFRTIQAYTGDMDRLKAAVLRATSGERSNFDSDSQGLNAMLESTKGSEGAAAAASASSGGAVDGSALSNEAAAAMVQSMADMSEMLTREDLGRMSVFSLWGVLKELKKLPGRKTVLYFAEGLQMPNGLLEQFKSMISDANRANVSVYAIDARGLMTASDQGLANRQLRAAAQWSTYVRTTEHETAAGNMQEFRTFDRAMDSLRANGQNVMMELAEMTGGFLIANTNDFRKPLQKLSEEFNTYYEVSYRPTNELLDGRFRTIEVKVRRSGAVVQARNGYFALPVMEGQSVYPYEAPLLRALGGNPLPHALGFRSAVVRYRWRDGREQAVLVFDLPLKDITFVKDEQAGKYRTHISVLALVKDPEGRVITKLSRDVPLNEPLDKLAGFQSGRFIVTRMVNLAPGRYTLESVAADQEGNRLGARKSVHVVVPGNGKVDLSELVLVRRLDKPVEHPDLLDPMSFTTGRVVPTLLDRIPGGKGRMLSVYFVAYPDESSTQRPKLVLDLLKDGNVLTRSTPDLPAADVLGRVPFLANTPLDLVGPGQYEFRATLLHGDASAQKSIYINVE